MPRQATSEASKGVHFLLELHVANECRVVVCIRQWGRASCPIAGGVPRIRLQGHPLRPIAEAVPFAGPKEMIDSFSNDPHIWRMPIMHYALPIKRRLLRGLE